MSPQGPPRSPSWARSAPFAAAALVAASSAFLFLPACLCPAPASRAPSSALRAEREPTADSPRNLSPTAGAADLGDPYYPGLGNGGYDVGHYELTLDVDVATGVIEAVAEIRAEALHDLSGFNLDLYGLDVDEVLVDGTEADWDRFDRELEIVPAAPIPEGAEFTCRVTYGGVPEVAPDAGVPFVPGVGWWRMPSGIYVVSECVGAASWFPCNDHPLDKATFSYAVTVTDPYVVAANGKLLDVVEDEDARTYVFRASDPMATYLATVNIAEFGVREEEGPEGLPLTTYHPLDVTEAELREFARTGEMLAHFTELFGPYPFESYGAVISYETLGGALETQTLPVYSRGSTEPVVAHELAHQWFGNCVSPAAWSEMWLNEGFASYAEWLWLEHLEGTEALEERARDRYALIRRREIGPPADPGVENVFSGRVYVRGALVLHELRNEVGDETFFAILRAWVERNWNAHGTTDAFIALSEELAARDLDDLFQAVLFDEVLPEIPRYEEQLAAESEESGTPAPEEDSTGPKEDGEDIEGGDDGGGSGDGR